MVPSYLPNREAVLLTSIEKIDALVAGVTRADIQRMPPAHRQRLAQVLRHIADLADPPRPQSPGAGVLAELRDGQRVE
jgi:hypothetical protein